MNYKGFNIKNWHWLTICNASFDKIAHAETFDNKHWSISRIPKRGGGLVNLGRSFTRKEVMAIQKDVKQFESVPSYEAWKKLIRGRPK